MKTIATLLITLITSVSFAQGNYEKGMQQAFKLWGEQKYEEASNLFERIALAEKENWLPFYYASQVRVSNSFNNEDRKSIIPNLEKAQDLLNQAKTWSADNAEITVLQAMVHTAYVVYDGAKYGMELSPKIEALYGKAKTIEPKNPRAHLNHIEWKMGSARFFGKDPNVYCPDLEKVVVLFDSQNSKEAFYPNWGKNRALSLVKECANN